MWLHLSGQPTVALRFPQAAVYWQTYDAFARVSMSVGINQLMLGMSYYILGSEPKVLRNIER